MAKQDEAIQSQVKETIAEALAGVRKEFGRLDKINIVVAGISGVGKSTLLNAAFGDELAEAGIGKPVTDKIQLYEKANYPIRIYDTVGFELNVLTKWKSMNGIQQLVRRTKRTKTQTDDIHCLWYCVSASGARIQGPELKFMKYFRDKGIPVILVLTKAYSKKDADALAEAAKAKIPGIQTVAVVAQDTEFMQAYGVDELINKTASILPEALQNSFAAAQKPEVQLKRSAATKIVAVTMATNFGTGFVPILNAPIMLGAQSTMLKKITSIYEVNLSTHQLETVVASSLGLLGAVTLGKSAAASLLAVVPQLTLITGTVSGAVAAAITGALGYAYIELMEMVVAGKIDLSQMAPKEVTDVFVDLIKKHMPANFPGIDDDGQNAHTENTEA